jgi:multimeric flavodoxin WrbA
VIVTANPGLLKNKVGLTAVETLNHFFLNKEMIIMGSTHWNMVYGKDIGDVV